VRDKDGYGGRAAVVRHVWVGAVDSPCSAIGNGSGGKTNPFCDRHKRKAVISSRFVRETEKGEENDRANDDEPTAQLNAKDLYRIRLPRNGGNLIDQTKIGMGIVPTHIRLKGNRGQVEIDRVACQRNGAENFDASEAHETEIPAGAQIPVG